MKSILMVIILSLSHCVIFYPLVQKTLESENNSEKSALVALYILSDKESPKPGNGGILQKTNLGNASFTLSWTSGSDDKTDSTNLQYRVYVSTSDNIRSVGEVEANGEALTSFSQSLTSLEINHLRIRSTVSYYNVLVQDSLGKKSAYSSISASIIPKYFYALNQTDNSISVFSVDKNTGTLANTATLAGGNSPSML